MNEELKEHSLIILKDDLPGLRCEAGDVGTIVLVYDHGEAYEVEFMTADGKTVAVETLSADQIEPFT